MYLEYFHTDINKIIVSFVDITEEIHNDVLKYKDSRYPSDKHYKDFIKNNERYHLSFFDVDNNEVSEERNLTLSHIEEKFGKFIRFRVEGLSLLYNETGTIDNLSFNEHIDFNNSKELLSLLKQLFIVSDHYNRTAVNFILNDGSIIEFNNSDYVDVISEISNDFCYLSVDDILSTGVIFTNINSIVFSGIPSDEQIRYVDKWLSFNSTTFTLSFYKDGEYHSSEMSNILNINDVYKIVDSFYNDDKLNNLFEKKDFNYCSFNHIFKKHLLYSDYIQHLDENIKYKKKTIYTDLDNLLEILAQIVYSTLDTKVLNQYLDSGYSYNYVYNKKNDCIISYDLTKNHIKESSWHPIYIQFTNNAERKNKWGMYCVRRITNKPYSHLTDEEFIYYSTDPVYITVNSDEYNDVNDVKRSLKHEFIHVIERWGKTSFDYVQSRKGGFGNIKNVFEHISGEDVNDLNIFDKVRGVCYTIDQHEELAIINELDMHIRDCISVNTVNNTNFDSLANNLLINNDNIHYVLTMYSYLVDIRNINLENYEDVVFLLVLAYYLNYHKYCECYCPQIRKENIQKYINKEIVIKPNKINWLKNRIDRYVTEMYLQYVQDVRENICSTLKTLKR